MIMKKIFLSVVLGLLSINTFAQNNESTPLFSVSFKPGFGNGKVHSSDFENQHGIFNGGNLLLNYHITEHLFVSTGLGILTFNANSLIDGALVATEVDFFQLPVKINYMVGSNTIKFKAGVTGFYNSHLTSVTDIGSDQTLEETNLGGNFGLAADIGTVFQISNRFSACIGLEHQFTVSKVTGRAFDIENYLVKFGIQYALYNKK